MPTQPLRSDRIFRKSLPSGLRVLSQPLRELLMNGVAVLIGKTRLGSGHVAVHERICSPLRLLLVNRWLLRRVTIRVHQRGLWLRFLRVRINDRSLLRRHYLTPLPSRYLLISSSECPGLACFSASK